MNPFAEIDDSHSNESKTHFLPSFWAKIISIVKIAFFTCKYTKCPPNAT